MDKQTVIEHFGSIRRTAEALGLSYQAVHQWPARVPMLSAYRIEKLTGGALQVEEDVSRGTRKTPVVAGDGTSDGVS